MPLPLTPEESFEKEDRDNQSQQEIAKISFKEFVARLVNEDQFRRTPSVLSPEDFSPRTVPPVRIVVVTLSDEQSWVIVSAAVSASSAALACALAVGYSTVNNARCRLSWSAVVDGRRCVSVDTLRL